MHSHTLDSLDPRSFALFQHHARLDDMVETAADRQLAGAVLLSRLLARREPRIFLQRNLEMFLDAHERLLAARSGKTPLQHLKSRQRRRADWKYPTESMLEHLTAHSSPVLRIEHLRLQPPGSKVPDRGEQIQRKDSGLYDLLPDPDEGRRQACTVQILIPEPKNGNVRSPLYKESLQGTLVRRSLANGQAYFDIELRKPCLISIDQFRTDAEQQDKTSSKWRRQLSTQYSLHVYVQFEDAKQALTSLSEIEPQVSPTVLGRTASEGRLKATWEDLPRCPREGEMLVVTRQQGHKSERLKFRMAVSMAWSKRKKSPLEQYNQVREQVNNEQLPTPSASDAQEPPTGTRRRYVIRYQHEIGAHMRVLTQDSLTCIMCSTVDQSRAFLYDGKLALKRDASTLDRLMLHYWTFHHHFEWTRGPPTTDEDGRVHATITIGKKDDSRRAMPPGRAGEEYSWVAPGPDRPFDLSAHVNGEETWTGGMKSRAKSRRARRPRQDLVAEEEDHTAAITAGEDVEIQPGRHKRFPVPQVPNVTFYSGLTKRPLLVGEMVSDSEDELYDHRIEPSERHGLRKLGFSEDAVDFHVAFNRHLDGEQSTSSVLMRGAALRFAKKQRGQQRSVEWIRAFETKLRHLQSHDILDRDIVDRCLGICRGSPEDNEGGHLNDEVGVASAGPLQSTPHAGGYRVNGKFASTPNGTPKPKKPHKWSGGGADRDIIADGLKHMGATLASSASAGDEDTEMPDAPLVAQVVPRLDCPVAQSTNTRTATAAAESIRNMCLCGRSATMQRAALACDNLHCVRGDFHLACVGLERRVVPWRCAECSRV